MAAIRILGSLILQMISTSFGSPDLVNSMLSILEIGICTLPEFILITMITKNAMASVMKTAV